MSKKGQELESQACPRARENDLSITDLGDETVVYDQLTHKASCLNAVTATVWKACDGKNTMTDLLDILRRSGFQDANEDIVRLALSELSQADLLAALPDMALAESRHVSRRNALRSIGKIAAITVPVISTISIQPAIAAGSCKDPTVPCSSGAECCSGLCVESPPGSGVTVCSA